MKTKVFAVLCPLSLLSGCMMAGMGGMGGPMPTGTHGEDATTTVSDRLIVKEVVMDGFRMTADFPSFAPSESLSYTVTLRDLGGRAITSEVVLFLTVSSATGSSATASPNATQIAPALRGGGAFIFKPAIPRDGPYRLRIVVERVGDTAMEPPLTLEQVVQLAAHGEHPADASQAAPRASWTPLVLLGAGVMAIMMIFAVR